jgi:uncharacterized membrane protein YgdD (TMEM256/DUF423 family)
MKNFTRNILVIGAMFIAIAVILGAFGAHALRERLSPDRVEIFRTGVLYQFIHGFAILILGLLSFHHKPDRLRTSVILFALGIIFFSGSLYLLATQSISHLSVSFLGPVTPLGGLLFILGWLVFIRQIVKN